MRFIWPTLVLVALFAGCAEPPDASVADVARRIHAGEPPEKAVFEAGLDTAALVRATRRIVRDPDRLEALLDLLRGEPE